MTYSLHQHEQLAPKQEEAQLGKLFSFRDKKACYRKNYLGWDNIERVNQPSYCTKKTKYLNKQALAVMAAIVPKLERGERVIFNHKYLSSITLCKRRQNQNIIQELKIVLDIEYHNSVTHKGKKYRHSYEFLYKQQNQENISSSENSIGQFFARQIPPILYIENKDIEYIRSNVQAHESNFLQNSISFIPEETIAQKETSKVIPLKHKPICNKRKKNTHQERKERVYTPKFNQYQQPKTLSEHYPLTQEDCLKLQTSSGRPFTLNAMNEILLDISRKPKESTHLFPSKAAFMAYMGKLYRYEGRDAVKTANSGFKILVRATKADVIAYTSQNQRDEFMATFEQVAINCPTPENRFKAKIACTLPPMIGYNLLSSIKSVSFSSNTLEIHLANQLNIDHHKQAILKEAMAVDCKITTLSVYC